VSALCEPISACNCRVDLPVDTAHRGRHNASDAFSPPKLHHINIVSREVSTLTTFYRDVMKMDEMPIAMFPRNAQTSAGAGSDVPITFTTDGHMQMHLATQDLGVAFRSGEVINPIGVGPVGHIACEPSPVFDLRAAGGEGCAVARLCV
jgi:hypothetical protein